jgi:transcriptional regulator with XRE-family HTH domain
LIDVRPAHHRWGLSGNETAGRPDNSGQFRVRRPPPLLVEVPAGTLVNRRSRVTATAATRPIRPKVEAEGKPGMARHESPLDPSKGPLQSFAHDLRRLREKKGLTYRRLADRAGYSRTTLAEAANGRKLPALDVTLAYVEVCGGDVGEWTKRWHEVKAELTPPAPPTAAAPSTPATGRQPDPALRDLAAEVRRLWMNTGHKTVHLELSLAEQPDVVRDSYGDRERESTPLPPGTRLIDLFDNRFNRRCLILGGAGTGKTTTMLELARDLLARAEQTADAPVPVVFLLSRWTDQLGGLAAWIADEMAEHYKFDADRTRSWLASGRLVVLLDGLDEVQAPQRRACAQSINRFRRDASSSLTGLVVTSRTSEYTELGTRLELGGAVTISPLTPEQISRYLQHAGASFSRLRAAVDSDAVLAELLANPLMLGIASLAYQDGDQALEQGSIEQRRQRIFDLYVVRALGRDRTLRTDELATGAGGKFTAAATHRSLVWLARLMNERGETIFYPDWFTPGWLPHRTPATSARPPPGARIGWRRLATALTLGLSGGMICAVAYALHAVLANGVPSDTVLDVPPGFGLLIGFAVCLAITLTTVLAAPRTGRPRGSGLGGRLLRLSFCGFVFVVAAGLLHGANVLQRDGPAKAIVAAAAHGIGFGLSGVISVLLALYLARWLAKGRRVDRDARWHWSWHRMERGIFTGIVISPAVGVAHAFAYAVTHRALHSVHAVLFGLGQGLIMGLAVGLAIGVTFALVDIDADRPAAQWHWSLPRLASAAVIAAGYTLTFWLLLLAVQAFVGPASGAYFGLLIGLIFWITFALGHGLAPDRTQPPPAPARALSASLRAATPPAVTIAFLVALAIGVIAHFTSADFAQTLRLNLAAPTVLAGALTFWLTGGGAWLAHHVARWVAARAGLLPYDLLGFLAYADERLLLHRAGGGYQFLHLALQQHIANRDPDTAFPSQSRGVPSR